MDYRNGAKKIQWGERKKQKVHVRGKTRERLA